ncbi:hypothetical protein GGS21DRAFT_488850 [Xylaria nigripes]|nr:hypothetical protein GGS21DRAFT_488850 [Xylaria nigripes]
MENPDNPVASPGSQTSKRKGRNSAIRKEQNRVASRAYREKRKQKLALLDELLRSDSHADSMSSVSDETEYRSSTPGSECRAIGYAGGTRHSSTSPVPSYAPATPELTLVSTTHQPLIPNGPGHNTETCVDYRLNGYCQGPGRLAPHAEFAHNPSIPTIEMNSGHISSLCCISSVPSMPMFTYGDASSIDCSFNEYPLPNGGVAGFTPTSEYDINMAKALDILSKLSDSQQQEIVAYIQKKTPLVQRCAAQPAMSVNPSCYPYHAPRSSQVPGMKALDG